ncbi:MAG: calcium-binding protein [Microcoleaceae cyanobacterium]
MTSYWLGHRGTLMMGLPVILLNTLSLDTAPPNTGPQFDRLLNLCHVASGSISESQPAPCQISCGIDAGQQSRPTFHQNDSGWSRNQVLSSHQGLISMSSENPIILTTTEVDTLLGGVGQDTFSLRNNGDQLNIALFQPPATEQGSRNSESLVGTLGEDVIYPDSGDDTVSSFKGNDVLNGGFGSDLLFSGQGNDIGIGDVGDDTIFGDIGVDSLYGGGGNDVLFGNINQDTVFGDQGDDTIYGGAGNDNLQGGSGSDLILGDRDDDILTGVSRRGRGVTLISDFDPNEDTILLPGNATQYQLTRFEDLEVSLTTDLPNGTAIVFFNSSGQGEVIAIVEGDLQLDLADNSFGFI